MAGFPMEVATRQHGPGRTVLEVSGEVDLSTSPHLRQELLTALKQNKAVIVDMARVEYIDSSGITSLIEALKRARETRAAFALAAVSAEAMRVLHLARLDQIFSIHDSLDAALAATEAS